VRVHERFYSTTHHVEHRDAHASGLRHGVTDRGCPAKRVGEVFVRAVAP
jgi:hypothetical protein